MTEPMTRERVEKIIADARNKGERPDLSGLNLSDMDLSNMDLSDMDLFNVDLSRSNLSFSDLSFSDLSYTDLRNANLAQSNLYGASLRNAHLLDAKLARAKLTFADLSTAILTNTILEDVEITHMRMYGLFLNGLPSGQLVFVPTPEGWSLTIGCWSGTTSTLREMITKNSGWPEARGEEITKRRPMLEAMVAACEAYAAAHPDALSKVKKAAEQWEKNHNQHDLERDTNV